MAKVFALTFDEDIDFICDIVLPNNIVNTMGVSDIKRMKGTDVLFCGTNAAIFVVEWTGSHFVILHQIEEIHSCECSSIFSSDFLGLLNSIAHVGDTIFTVSHKDEHINRITFRS